MTKHDHHDEIEELLEVTLLRAGPALDERILHDMSIAIVANNTLFVDKDTSSEFLPSFHRWSQFRTAVRRRPKFATAIGLATFLAFAVVVSAALDVLSGRLAFAQVQEALRMAKTVQFERSIEVLEATDAEFDGRSSTREKVMIVEPNRFRSETIDGKSIHITDRRLRRSIVLRPPVRIAHVAEVFANDELLAEESSWQEWVRTIGDSETKATRLGEKQIDGETAVEFLSDIDGISTRYFVAPITRRPLRIEIDSKNAIGKFRVTYSQFVFDEPIDERLFDTQPPDDYEVKPMRISRGFEESRPNSTVKATIGKEWRVSPLSGVGPVAFGMTKEQIVSLLGEPGTTVSSHVSVLAGHGKPGEQLAPDYRPGPDEMMVRHKEIPVEVLSYGKAGVQFSVAKDEGVIQISCVGQIGEGLSALDFAGRTKKGIGLGASIDEVNESHGTRASVSQTMPKINDGMAILGYYVEGYQFEFKDGRLVRIVVRNPGRVGWGLQQGLMP